MCALEQAPSSPSSLSSPSSPSSLSSPSSPSSSAFWLQPVIERCQIIVGESRLLWLRGKWRGARQTAERQQRRVSAETAERQQRADKSHTMWPTGPNSGKTFEKQLTTSSSSEETSSGSSSALRLPIVREVVRVSPLSSHLFFTGFRRLKCQATTAELNEIE